LRELFFVVPAHNTVEQKLGRESSRENRSSSFLHTRSSSRNSEEKAVETVLRRSCTKTIEQQFSERNQPREKHAAAKHQARQAKPKILDEITDSGDTIKSFLRIRTKHERDQADQMCRLLPTNEGSAKPTEYGPEHH
jgi:hypothetical protein